MRNRLKKILLSFSVILLPGLFFHHASADPIPEFSIITEEWKPYNFEENGRVIGISADMLVLILEKIGSKQGRDHIQLLPWARGYLMLQKKPNTILFSTTRSKEREKMFKWVGPIVENRLSLFALKSRKIKINSPEAIKHYKIATYFNDAGEQILVDKFNVKLEDLHRSGKQLDGLRRVAAGRNDLFVGSEITLVNLCKKGGFDRNDFEQVYVLSTNDISYAFHRDTPDSMIRKFQRAFDDIKADGTLDDIKQKYFRH